MPNFMDLPKPVREKIYCLHLVADKQPVDFTAYKQTCGYTETSNDLSGVADKPAKIKSPALSQVSRKIEREASPIYFGENTFALCRPESLGVWKRFTMPRHIKQIRKITLYCWKAYSPGAPGDATFKAFSTLSRLESLTFRVDEEEEVRNLLTSPQHQPGHRIISWHSSLGLGPQVNLQMLRCDGIAGLRSLRGLRQVKFVKDLERDGDDPDNVGSMPGGFLETVIKQEIMQPRSPQVTPWRAHGSFRFLDLPPELRNIIYSILLLFPGPTYPLAEKPLSVTSRFKFKKQAQRDAVSVPSSVLQLLQINKQIHDEAHKLFYQNDLVFSSPVEILEFTASLGDGRFHCLRSLTLFCGEFSQTLRTHESGLGGAMSLVRRLKGLQKLHLMLRFRTIYVDQRVNSRKFIDPVDVSRFKDAKTLFTLRGVADVKVHDLDLAEIEKQVDDHLSMREDLSFRSAQRCIAPQIAALRHFNHGLQLAQTGVIVEKLYTEVDWRSKKSWPALQGSDCGYSKGCSCGVEEVKPAEVIEILDDSD